ncbi:PD40 domain-containing protein [Larkinella knui]|nr:PD40 domain-containing protein [Larkinella knui]
MKRSLFRLLPVFLTLLMACKEKAVDPTRRVRTVSLQISVAGTFYDLSWEPNRIVCITAPCPDVADVEAQEYEVQVATSELGAFHTYRTLSADAKSIRIPAADVGEQLVARIVSKNKGAPPANSNPVMASTAFLSQSAYYPGFGLTNDVVGGDVTPDGAKAVYTVLVQETAGTYATPLYVADLQNEQPITIKLITRLGAEASFSPNGNQLAYPSKTENGLIIYDMKTATSRTLPVADVTGIGSIAWSPDGKWLAYSTVSNDESRLWKMATSGGPATALTPVLPVHESNYIRQSSLDWSPDGRFIALSRARNDNSNDKWRATLSFYSPDGSGEVRYFETQPSWIDTQPSFSPDGKQLAFLSSRTDGLNTSYSLWVRDVATGKIRQIKLLPGLNPSSDYAPRWVGNERLVFMAVVQGKKAYYSVFL